MDITHSLGFMDIAFVSSFYNLHKFTCLTPIYFSTWEERWHTLIPLANTNLADNVNLHARHRIILTLTMMTTKKMLQDVGGGWCHSLNTMLFSCRIMMAYPSSPHRSFV